MGGRERAWAGSALLQEALSVLRYLSHRLLEAAFVLLGMSFLIYLLLGLMPGDPIDLMASGDPDITSQDLARLKAIYGLDRPLLERYAHWLQGALAGDFGYSRLYARPVTELMAPRLANTALLMGLSFVLALIVALPAGILAALRAAQLDRLQPQPVRLRRHFGAVRSGWHCC